MNPLDALLNAAAVSKRYPAPSQAAPTGVDAFFAPANPSGGMMGGYGQAAGGYPAVNGGRPLSGGGAAAGFLPSDPALNFRVQAAGAAKPVTQRRSLDMDPLAPAAATSSESFGFINEKRDTFDFVQEHLKSK